MIIIILAYKYATFFSDQSPSEPLKIVTQPVDYDEQKITVEYNRELILKCLVTGYPQPEYQWTVNDTIIPEAIEPVYVVCRFFIVFTYDYSFKDKCACSNCPISKCFYIYIPQN